MKAIQIAAPNQVSLTEIGFPVPGPGDALIQVMSAGICGSDIGAYRGANPMVTYPRVIGHEIAGVVLSIPADNPKGIQVGDAVIVEPYVYCGHCYPCSLSRTNCCTSLKTLGVHTDGGMCERIAHPAHMLCPVPQGMPWDIIPLAEPTTIALHGLHRARLKAGEHVAIFGAGTIGLLAALCAMHYGATPILIDPVEERLAIARSLGVHHTTDPARAVECIGEWTGGRMAEVVLEASGAAPAIIETLNVVSFAGRISLIGWPKNEVPLLTERITRKEVDLLGSRNSAGEFEEALDLIHHGKIDARSLLTQKVTLEEAPAIIADISANPGNYLKVHVMVG